VHALGGWTNTIEFQAVDDKTRVVRPERSADRPLLAAESAHASYEFEHVRIDLSVENVFDRFYSLPLGGAYVGQGASMSSKTIHGASPSPARDVRSMSR
jgi:iron complex outermembrane receptor protein